MSKKHSVYHKKGYHNLLMKKAYMIFGNPISLYCSLIDEIVKTNEGVNYGLIFLSIVDNLQVTFEVTYLRDTFFRF